MTAKEIAERFGVSVYTVRNWINKARKEESEEVTNG
ncbi:sigma factor-like helix-turn-helix DNA-binding protein [Fusicatenibacter saccharivorans]|jgi:transposase